MSQHNRHRRPQGLRGKDIGLYYKNLHTKKPKLDNNIVHFKIPPAVITGANKNLEAIERIAKRLNIHLTTGKQNYLSYTGDSNSFDNNYEQFKKEIEIVSNTNTETYIKRETSVEDNPNLDSYGTQQLENKFSQASTSFNNIQQEGAPNQRNGISNWTQGAGDFKYSYKDIITGTFEEKLEECLNRGIEINIKNEFIMDLNKSLYEEYMDMLHNSKYKKYMKFREKLPTYKKSGEILDTIRNNQVVVISGETGCGKSTQVPQLILDDAILNNRGANVKILVTQPRRIAASSLAMRVAEERGEPMGQSVGYAIRLEKVDCRLKGSIVFCTTGILLAELEVNQGLTEYSHVILDEVHERDTHIDLSMCMLKKVLNKRKDLKLILMSATIDSEKLSAYFDNSPMLHIEGLAYPVKDIYLEEILTMVNYELPMQNKYESGARGKPWHKRTRVCKKNLAIEMEKGIQYRAEISRWLESIKRKLSRHVYMTLQDHRIEELNIDLIFELVQYICHGDPGAILVFLPGIADITKLLRMMTDSGQFPRHNYEIYPLHSKLPSLEQHKIFERPPGNVRKIIVATNIAETSITIDDIVYVIDSGRIKYSGLNIEDNISTLNTEWVSKANLKQRRGRAGRCQPGVCYHMVTSFRAEKLEERLLPEMQRSDLLEPVLAIKKLRLGKAREAMNLMAAVPAQNTIEHAIRRLQECGALDANETLTPLGWHLARLPVHPCAGKLLIFGALFGCLDRAASVAAVWGFKDPFQMVIGKEKEVDIARREFALGVHSDHVAISEAIIQWESCPDHSKRSFAYDNFLSNNTLQLLSDMKQQFGDNLKQMGFLRTGNICSKWENRNADNLSLFKAIVAASLYPNVANVKWRIRGRVGRTIFKVTTPEDGPLSLHPSSVMNKNQHQGFINLGNRPNWLVYWMKQRSSDLFLLEVTFVETLPLLFFGELAVTEAENSSECELSIKSTKVNCKRDTTELLFRMRALLDQVLTSRVTKSNDRVASHNEFEEEVLNAVVQLITAEDEGADYIYEEDE